jgi:hypothetical protein
MVSFEEPDGSVNWALRIVSPVDAPDHLPEDEPVVHASVLDGLARAVPQIAQAVQRGLVFELIGPGAALEGLRNGSLEMIPAKTGGLLGGIQIKGTSTWVHQARFKPVKVASAVGPGLAMTAASAVLGHLHMVEIRKQLTRIEGKLDRVLEGQHAERHGKLLGSVEVLQDVSRSMGASGTASPLQLQRLVAVELDLRQVAGELEQIHRQYAERTSSLRGGKLGTTRRIELDDARLYVAATGALVVLERLLFEYASGSEPATLPSREVALNTARNRLAAAETTLSHLRQFHEHCRHALDEDQARSVRLSTRESETVSTRLHEDRVAVAELLGAAQRLTSGPGSTSALQVVRVDARGGVVRAQAALLEGGSVK